MAVQYAFGKIITQGLDLNVDAADPTSYPGSGTSWTNVVNRSITGSIISCSFSSDFKGGLVFNNPSASVVFPGTLANYGTGSFTVEMAFRPDQIEGKHYLVSKNSGSYPNWGVYLSGSGGSGKLWAEYNIDASVSCSVSSSTTFGTGSTYQADIVLAPGLSGSGMSVDGVVQGTVLGNGGGSLTTTSSFFVGSYSTNTTQNFSGSIYLLRTYSTTGFTLPVVNYNTTSTRFSKPPIPETGKKRFELLVVAGGGSSGGTYGGGGGAGGLRYFSNYTPSTGTSQVIVGNGGLNTNGQNSSFESIISLGGGYGGGVPASVNGNTGGSGGGGRNNGILGLGTLGQGNNGANGLGGVTGGGGGGAGTAAEGKNGGSGSYIASFATIGGLPAGWFAGGGGGGQNVSGGGIGGIGGGGAGNIGNTAGFTGSANTGGGAGGGTFNAPTTRGGSGIVAIRYSGGPIAIGGEITQSEGYTYHVYRTVGTSSFTIF